MLRWNWIITLLVACNFSLGQADEEFEWQEECCTDPFDDSWFSADRFSGRVEGLFWRASEDNLGFGIKGKFDESSEFDQETETTTPLDRTNNVKQHPEFKWKPGIRVGLGYVLPCLDWKLDLTWTHLTSGCSQSATAANLGVPTLIAPGQVITTLQSTFLPVGNRNVNSIDAKWHLGFNNYELNLSRKICVSNCFSFSPYIGLKYLEIKQTYNLDYVINTDPNFPSILPGTIKQQIKTRYEGFGFQGGINADWNLGCGFGLYSNASGGVVYGSAHSHDFVREEITGTTNTITNFKDISHFARPNLDFVLGIKWQRYCSDWFLITLNVGWEYHYYFDQNFFRQATSNDPTRGSLALHGVTFGAGLEF